MALSGDIMKAHITYDGTTLTLTITDTVKTAPSARTIAIDPASGRIFLPAADVASVTPPAQPGGRPKVTFVPGSLKLLILDPS